MNDDKLPEEVRTLLAEMESVAADLPEEQRGDFWLFVADLCRIARERQHAAQIRRLCWWPGKRHA